MSFRALLVIPLALILTLTVLVATSDPPDRPPTRVAPLVPTCPSCAVAPPWIWIPWLPVPLPTQWRVG